MFLLLCNYFKLIVYLNLVPSRLIDFHFILLKKLSLAKNTQREKFDSIISRVFGLVFFFLLFIFYDLCIVCFTI